MYLVSSHAIRLLPTPGTPVIDTRRGRLSRAVVRTTSREQPELVVATDEGRLDLVAPAAAAALGHDPDGTERGHRGDLALEHLVAGGLEGDGRIRRLLGLLADEDRARRGHALEARRGVDDVARDETLVGGTDGDRGLPGQDAGPCLDPGTERPDAVDQVERGADRAFGVVVVRDRRAPDGHHGVADELLDRPAVAADDLLALLEIARQEVARRPRRRGSRRAS